MCQGSAASQGTHAFRVSCTDEQNKPCELGLPGASSPPRLGHVQRRGCSCHRREDKAVASQRLGVLLRSGTAPPSSSRRGAAGEAETGTPVCFPLPFSQARLPNPGCIWPRHCARGRAGEQPAQRVPGSPQAARLLSLGSGISRGSSAGGWRAATCLQVNFLAARASMPCPEAQLSDGHQGPDLPSASEAEP